MKHLSIVWTGHFTLPDCNITPFWNRQWMMEIYASLSCFINVAAGA